MPSASGTTTAMSLKNAWPTAIWRPTRSRVMSHSRPPIGANSSWTLVCTDMAPARPPQNHELAKPPSASCAEACDGSAALAAMAVMASAKPNDLVRLVDMVGGHLERVASERHQSARHTGESWYASSGCGRKRPEGGNCASADPALALAHLLSHRLEAIHCIIQILTRVRRGNLAP